MGTRKTNIPAIPDVTDNTVSITRFAQASKEVLEVGLGRRGDPLDRFATLRDLKDSGIANVTPKGASGVSLSKTPAESGAGGAPGATRFTPGDPNLGQTNYTPPPAPKDVEATAMPPDGLMVTWNPPDYANHAYTEVFRLPETGRQDDQPQAPTFELAAGGFDVAKPVGPDNPQPDFVGTAAGTIYSDAGLTRLGDDTLGDDLNPTAYWYWVRFVSTAGVPGPYAPLNGVSGQLPVDPAKVLGQLISNVKDQSVYADLLNTYYGSDAWGDVLSTHGGLVEYIQSLDGKVKTTIDAQLVRLIGASDNKGGADTLIRMLDNVTGQAGATSASLNDMEQWQAALATVGNDFAPATVPMHQYRNREDNTQATWLSVAPHHGMQSLKGGDRLTIHSKVLAGVDGKRVVVTGVNRNPHHTLWTVTTERTCTDGTPLPLSAGYITIDGTHFTTTPNPDAFVDIYASVYRNVFVKVDTDSAIGRMVENVSSQVGEVAGQVQETQKSIARVDGTQESMWTVRMKQTGPDGMLAAAGFGLGLDTTENDDGTYDSVSTFLVNANQFAVMGNHAGGGLMTRFETRQGDHTKATITLNTSHHGFESSDEAVMSIPDGTRHDGKANPLIRYGGLQVTVREVHGRTVVVQRMDASAFHGATTLDSGALLPAPNMPFMVDTATQTVGVRGKLVVDGLIRATAAELNTLTANTAFLKQLQAEVINANVVVGQRLIAGAPGSGATDTQSSAYRGNYVMELNNPVVSNWPMRFWKPSTGVTNFGLNQNGDVFIGGNLSVGENATIATTGDHLLSIGGAGVDTGRGQYDLWIGPRGDYGVNGGRRAETNGMIWAKSSGRVGINADVFLGDYPLSPPDADGNIRVRPSRDGRASTVFCAASLNMVPDVQSTSVRTVLGVRLYLTPSNTRGDARHIRAGVGYSHGCSRTFLDSHVRIESYWGESPPDIPGYLVADTQFDFYHTDIANVSVQGAVDVPAGNWKVFVQVWSKPANEASLEAAFGGSFFAMVAR